MGSPSRRHLLQAFTAVAIAATTRPRESHANRIWRIGLFEPYPRGHEHSAGDRLALKMNQLGYVEGKDIEYVHRFPKGVAPSFGVLRSLSQLPSLAAELVRARPDALVGAHEYSIALARATSTIPIVALIDDPVAAGFAKSLANPGGNVTGLANLTHETYGKEYEFLKEIIPGNWGLAVIVDEVDPHREALVLTDMNAARKSGIRVHRMSFKGKSAEQVDRMLAAMPGQGIRAIGIWDAVPGIDAENDPGAFIKYGLVNTWSNAAFVARGALLLTYHPVFDFNGRMAAQLVKILRGKPPGEIPFEVPSSFRLVINLKVAKALGLTVPPSVLLRADKVYE